MKSTNAFETSGNSPTVSENGAPLLTGRGLEDVKRRIKESFEKIRYHQRHNPTPTPTPPSPQQIIYTEEHEVHFHARAKKLTMVALMSSEIIKTKARDISEIAVPAESAEELIAEALRRFK